MCPTTNQTQEYDSKPNSVVLKAINELIRQKYPKCQFNYDIESAAGKGENTQALVFRLVTQICDEEQRRHIFKLIVKVAHQNPMRRKLALSRFNFTHEAFAYNEFLPLVTDFQLSKGLTADELFNNFCVCYAAMTEEFNEAIILEDLCERDYRMYNRFKLLDIEHVSLVMQTYAKLHAVSFAIKDQAPEKLAQYRELEDIFSNSSVVLLQEYFEQHKQRAVNTLNDPLDQAYKQKFVAYFEQHDYHQRFTSLLNGKAAEPYSVVCHGDGWNNNVMFKYNNQQHAVSALILDWQLIRYASPITDIMYYLFSSTCRNFRQKYYYDMLNVYYDTLCAHIKRLGSNAEQIFPRSIFDREVQKIGAVGCLFSMILLPAIVTLPEDSPNLDEVCELVESGKMKEIFNDPNSAPIFANKEQTEAVYRKRMRDVIVDAIDFGLI